MRPIAALALAAFVAGGPAARAGDEIDRWTDREGRELEAPPASEEGA
jgi:hypothetical protein